ncbi:TIGR02171 family protein [Fibrobacter sp. UWB5]|uniref:TIGR02171 family lipoprotein n=1 Tax=Fibrobacter sp. UWB5 TaxID=1964360 RepID=UPI000B52502B|nr:TIGR02171 family protein [Fibrobacter sp. UWB5]OWV10305.1 hypothetical protein B7989_11870 [Fibrobacter sp. UWB5]
MMKFFYCIIALLALFSFEGCSNSEYVSIPHDDPSALDSLDLKDFALMRANGKIVILGTDESSASIKDGPAMKVSFDYDFMMGRHEVTCNEMGLDCGDLPVTDVTFFDAVLYANKRSKEEGFDTVYSYSKAIFDDDSSCVGLESFKPHWDVLGYRLPTEAEWVFVTTRGWEPKESWTSANSDYELHDVCTSYYTLDSICDMAGNAMEWVGDYLVTFTEEEWVDFVGGARDYGPDERVVKGGSFRNAPETIKPYTRGDIYLVTASTKAEYIGFRLALGAIPHASQIGNVERESDSDVSVSVSSKKFKSLAATNKGKLVFREDKSGNLYYVDFSKNDLVAKELSADVSAYHPDISPDGKWVAFCTGIEGVADNSELYVRKIDASDKSLIKLNVKSAVIPRWRVLANGDTVIVYVTSAANNKNDESFAQTSTWQVKFSNGKFGTPKKLFDGAYHGGVSDDNRLAVTGARLLRANRDGRSEIWYNGEQACNASLNRNNNKMTLFLDFGGKTGRQFVRSNYETHKRIFFADSTGNLVHSLEAPEGYTFDHPEWVPLVDSLIVATLVNSEGAHRKLILANVYTERWVELAQGTELWHPALWLDVDERVFVPPLLDIDSAGVYYTDQMESYALDLRVKMEWFWKSHDTVTAVVLGSSRVMFGINSSFIHSESVLNMGFPSGDIHAISFLTLNYVLTHMPKLKYAVLEFSPDFMWDKEALFWSPVYKKSPGFKYDKTHKFWKDSIPKGFVELVEESYKPIAEQTQPYDYDEFLMPSNGWGKATVVHDTMKYELDDDDVDYNMALYKFVVNSLVEKGVQVILVVPPQNPGYAKTGAFGIYAGRRSHAEELLKRAAKLNAVMMDENKMGKHDYTSSMAYNTDHLSREGAKQLSERLDSLFVDLQK